MRTGVFKVARIAGIDIKVHWSWAIILLLIVLPLSTGFFPTKLPGESSFLYLGLGVLVALLIFLSVLLHELSHSFMAKARGLPVRDITLFIFGGVSSIEKEPERPLDEFLVAVVGPLTSLGLGVLFMLLGRVVPQPFARTGILQYMSQINYLLGFFNLIPGFPLDGGRVLRALIWGVSHSYKAATRWAGVVGQFVAYFFIFLGLYRSFVLDDFGGLWLAFIGWFLLNAAQASVRNVKMSDMARGMSVKQLMEPPAHTVAERYTMSHVLTQFMFPYKLREVLVVDEGRLLGVLTLAEIHEVPQEEWGTVSAGERMTPADRVTTVRPQDKLEDAMRILSMGDSDQLPVVDPGGALVGVLTRVQLLRWAQLQEEIKQTLPHTT